MVGDFAGGRFGHLMYGWAISHWVFWGEGDFSMRDFALGDDLSCSPHSMFKKAMTICVYIKPFTFIE